ncbi:PREDICTED: collagen alpha-1(XII) chain-like [Branchiostoma belcheri]|uniref:Collagen alpha-1(XII) chain-like n=1 Tax=Branchiostoma belcheri TaxID=7741 RepID=A0A6P5AK25_BRABE|nr:PREDICTED: collagen alpha-1(XII) chain-like [Branchiostoma belcheri]
MRFLVSSVVLLLLSTAARAWLYDTTSVDCLQSEWSEWMKVGYNTRLRSRVILRHPSNGGTACGPNEETEQLPAGETITPQETARAFDTFFLKGQSTTSRNPGKERDLLIILDESGSIGLEVFNDAKEALARLLGYICPGIGPSYPYHQIAFMTFSSSYTEHFDFNDYGTYTGVSNAIRQVTYSDGGTNTHNALDYARTTMFANGDFSVSSSTKGLRPGSLKEVLLITDGRPNSDSLTEAAAERLRNIGVSVFALGIGNVIQSHMEQLISEPEYKHIFHLDSFADFHTMVESVELVYSGGERCVNLNPWSRRRNA